MGRASYVVPGPLAVIHHSRFTERILLVGTVQPLPQPFVSVVLDGSGNGTASLGPTRVREHWQVAGASVSVAVPPAIVNEATCSVYLGSQISPATFLSQTIQGSTGDVCTIADVDMQTGMQVWAVWKGGDAGVTATLLVNGTYSIGAPS